MSDLIQKAQYKTILAGVALFAALFWLNIGFALLKPSTGSFILKWIPSALLAFLVFAHRDRSRAYFIFCALLLQSAGAVVLDFNRTGNVLYSLIFTAGAHIMNAGAFYPGINFSRDVKKLSIAGVFLAYVIAYGSFIAGHVPSRMFVPVILYMTALSVSVLSGILSRRSWLIILGLLCFVLDDSVFSWHLFISPIPPNHFITWPSFITGQTLITIGFISRSDENV